MGKQKKRKTQHLSDAEIWDDSALIRSWDEAVAEYEYYHSIHARGEDVEEVLRQAELKAKAEAKAKVKVSVENNGKHAADTATAELDEDYEDGEIEVEALEDSTAPIEGDEALDLASKGIADIPSFPNGITRNANESHSDPLAQGSNQVLENIKMAYWWAGYYSGLYEGQQQPAQPDRTTTGEQQQT